MDAQTIDQFKAALPATLKKSVNQELIDKITATLNDPDMYDTYRDNLLGYTRVMQEGKFKMTSYIDAVKYVSHKLMGSTNLDAFSKTFPDKINRWTAKGMASKDIASYVTAYNKSKLVNLILEQTLIPSWVLNQDMYQKALNIQFKLATSANSEKVRSDAANSILTHLKQPETQKHELSIQHKEGSEVQALREATQALVAQQRQAIASGGITAQDATHQRLIIDGEATEVSDA